MTATASATDLRQIASAAPLLRHLVLLQMGFGERPVGQDHFSTIAECCSRLETLSFGHFQQNLHEVVDVPDLAAVGRLPRLRVVIVTDTLGTLRHQTVDAVRKALGNPRLIVRSCLSEG